MVDARLTIDHVVEIAVDDEVIVARLSGRRVHPGSGRVYHVLFNPPKTEGLDDETGEPLVQRDDDTDATVRKRLKIYHEQTSPLINFYRDMKGKTTPRYHRIEGVGSVEEIRKSIFVALLS
jgi:adenylate kinase